MQLELCLSFFFLFFFLFFFFFVLFCFVFFFCFFFYYLHLQIHAKISDYGIARFSAYEGLKAQEGTLAYRAPEVIRKENYSFEVSHKELYLFS